MSPLTFRPTRRPPCVSPFNRIGGPVASQSEVALTFLHGQHIRRMTAWTEATYAAYEKSERAKVGKTLTGFVNAIYKSLKIKPKAHQCIVQDSPFVDSTIMAYAADHGFD